MKKHLLNRGHLELRFSTQVESNRSDFGKVFIELSVGSRSRIFGRVNFTSHCILINTCIRKSISINFQTEELGNLSRFSISCTLYKFLGKFKHGWNEDNSKKTFCVIQKYFAMRVIYSIRSKWIYSFHSYHFRPKFVVFELRIEHVRSWMTEKMREMCTWLRNEIFFDIYR